MNKRVLFLVVLSVLLFACKREVDIPPAFPDQMEEDGFLTGDISLSANSTLEEINTSNQNTADDPTYFPDAIPPKINSSIMNSPWREFTDAPIQNDANNRSLDAYLAVILQFDVANSYPCRYQPDHKSGCTGGTNDTRCNIYASDVMNAMGAPLPTKGDLGVGHGNAKHTDPMPANANDTHSWLEKEQDGWRKIDPNNPADWALLQEHVSSGKPALASYYGVGEPGHVAVIRPDQKTDLATGDIGGLHIAQAGGYNANSTYAKSAFGSRDFNIYIHP
jgi:hypothetical protein